MNNSNIKILLLSQYFPPETGAGSNRAYEHTKRWIGCGADVTVITCMPNYPNGVIPEKYRGKKFYAEVIDGIKVVRTFTFATPNKGFIKRTLAYFSFMLSSVIQGCYKTKNFDLIIATSPPFTVGISGWLLSKIKRIPFVFEVRDLWPDSIIQLEQVKSKFIIKILRSIEIFLYKSAARIISVTDSYINKITEHGISADKIIVIKNGVDTKYFSPLQKNTDLIKELNLENKFIVSYFGTFGLSHSLETVLYAANILKEHDEICILLVGDGAEKDKLTSLKQNLNLSNVKILKTVPREKLKSFYSISDLMIVILKGIPLFETVIPSKIFEIMAVQKPILHAVQGESAEIVRNAKAGITIKPDDPQVLAEKILSLSKSSNELKEFGENGRSFVKSFFDRDLLANKLLDVFREVKLEWKKNKYS